MAFLLTKDKKQTDLKFIPAKEMNNEIKLLYASQDIVSAEV